MLLLALALLGQEPAGPPTVGDTVWVERTVRLPSGSTIRPRPVESSELLDPLGPPVVVVRGRDAVLRYPMVFWRAGSHRVEIPGPVAVRPDGWSDTLAAGVATVTIGSVLPAGPVDSIPPEAAAAVVERPVLSLQPLLVLGLLAVAGLAALHWWWRRRGEPVRPPPPIAPEPTERRLARWLAAGEHHAVLDAWRARLGLLPESPDRDRLLAAMETARFGSASAEEVDALDREARSLTGGAA